MYTYILGANVNADFIIHTQVAILNKFVIVTFLEDFIALEYNETFYLKLKPRSAVPPLLGLNVLFCDTIEITIVNSDCELINSFECISA